MEAMETMKKVLLIIENETSFTFNQFFNETVIQKRLKENDFDFIYELVFSNSGFKKVLAFRKICFEDNNKFDQHFYCSNGYREHFGDFDFINMFLNDIRDTGFDVVYFISGCDAQSVDFLENSLEQKLEPLNPYDLFDRDVYYKK